MRGYIFLYIRFLAMFSWLDIIIVGWVTNHDFNDVSDLDGKTHVLCGCKGRIRRHVDKASTGKYLIMNHT